MADKKYNTKYKLQGKCLNCGKQSRKNKNLCSECSGRHKKLYHERKNSNLCVKCGASQLETTSFCSKCAEKSRISKKTKSRELRRLCVKKYGGKCACCKEACYEFLTFDHVNNDGALHRKKIRSQNIVRWMIKNNFPKSIQILCWNCNAAKQYWGKCPHNK